MRWCCAGYTGNGEDAGTGPVGAGDGRSHRTRTAIDLRSGEASPIAGGWAPDNPKDLGGATYVRSLRLGINLGDVMLDAPISMATI